MAAPSIEGNIEAPRLETILDVPIPISTACGALGVEELRAGLAAAIRDRAWKSVEIIQGQIDDAERIELPAPTLRLIR